LEYFSVSRGGITDQCWPLVNFFCEIAARLFDWKSVYGTVEGYELIGYRQVAVLYSYSVAGRYYSGQFRKQVFIVTTAYEDKVQRVIERFPRGSHVWKCSTLRDGRGSK
jgi:hypothetical protein